MHIKEFPKRKGTFIERGRVCRERTKPKKVCIVIALFHLLLQLPLQQKKYHFQLGEILEFSNFGFETSKKIM
jgi:hypothetical protein